MDLPAGEMATTRLCGLLPVADYKSGLPSPVMAQWEFRAVRLGIRSLSLALRCIWQAEAT